MCVSVCMCVAASERMCLTLCVPAGKRRGHMLKMKMDIYHHRELGEGECRRREVAGRNVIAKKEKMKNGGAWSGGGGRWGYFRMERQTVGNRKRTDKWSRKGSTSSD